VFHPSQVQDTFCYDPRGVPLGATESATGYLQSSLRQVWESSKIFDKKHQMPILSSVAAAVVGLWESLYLMHVH
jgi:hypothetical protein